MTGETKVKLTKRYIDTHALPREKRYVINDSEVPGLKLRVYPDGTMVFFLYYRTRDSTQRWYRLGKYGEITVVQAKEMGRQLLARVRQGEDPSQEQQEARRALTVADLGKRYLQEHAFPHKKESSARMDELNLRLHILPHLGKRKVANVTHQDVAQLHLAIGTGDNPRPGAANRVLALLSKMFNLSEKWGLRPLNSNPCRHITKYREQRLHRDLSELELARLAKALREWPATPRKPTLDATGKRKKHSRTDEALPLTPEEVAVREQACDVLRLLLFTGLRRGEALNLKWSEVDMERGLLRLADSKTGAKVVALNSAAREVIGRQERQLLNPYVFPSKRQGRGHGKPITDLKNAWTEVRALAGLQDVRIHDLRHNFASFGAAGGVGLPVIGRLLGHKSAQTTARYAAVADDPARQATEAIGQRLTRAMVGGDE